MGDAVFHLDAVVLESATGLWCERCALPSAARVSTLILLDGKPFQVATSTLCEDCGEYK